MKTITVGSENPSKIAAVKAGFEAMFPDEAFEIRGVSVASGVSDQPMNDADTLRGATNRAQRAMEVIQADYAVGLEGGIEDINGKMGASAWIVVISRMGVVGKGKAGIFFLPQEVTTLVNSGLELGHAMDEVFGTENSKHSNGATGLLTNNALQRSEYYKQAVLLALIPHKNTDLAF